MLERAPRQINGSRVGVFRQKVVMQRKDPQKDWHAEFARSHQHPVNRACDTVGIPLVACSMPLFGVLFFRPELWPIPVALFVIGWFFQFAGHYAENAPPEFLHDWRFLLVGLRWWWAKLRRRA